MLECTAGVVRWVDEDALHLAGELLFQRLQRQQVVPEDQPVVEDVVVGDAVRRVIRLPAVLDEDARLQLRPVILADPRQFQLLLPVHPLHSTTPKSHASAL
jgi:hypothetical protein